MANYHIGLDFGTSQSKVCLLKTDTGVREFIKFENGSFFLPSIITKRTDNTFSYGKEVGQGTRYRYFKMASAEDDDLVQVTNEEWNRENGEWYAEELTTEELNNFKKYNEHTDIKPEILSVLYLSYILLYIKKQKENINVENPRGGLLGRHGRQNQSTENTFSVKMGIPTEWHNPVHIKRKIKFETILIVVSELVNEYKDLNSFLKENCDNLISKSGAINKRYSLELDKCKSEGEKSALIGNLRNKYRVSTYPESAAGIAFLLENKSLPNGYYGALDMGAGTSDISVFWVNDNKLQICICSESVSVASNDVYRDYSIRIREMRGDFNDIKQIEKEYHNDEIDSNGIQFQGSVATVRFKLEKLICNMYCHKYYYPHPDRATANDNKNLTLPDRPILLYGGGSFFGFIRGDVYRYFPTEAKYSFETIAVEDFIQQIAIQNWDKVKDEISLLIVALGLSHISADSGDGGFFLPPDGPDVPDGPDAPEGPDNLSGGLSDIYFYYDIQDAVFK